MTISPTIDDARTKSVPEKPQRIAFCITDLDPGGAEKALVQLVIRLDRTKWEPRVFCLKSAGSLAAELEKHGVAVESYGARNWRSWGLLPWLTRRLRVFQPRILQCWLFHANLLGRIAGARAGVPSIVAGHRVAEQGSRWHLRLDRWTRGLVDHHVCVSQGVADHLQKWLSLPPEQLTVIPNGINVPEIPSNISDLRQEMAWPSEAPVVLAVGRLHPQKGFLLLLEAFRRVLDRFPTARLAIIGEGPQRNELQARRAELQLVDHVALPGHRTDVFSLMHQSNLLVVSSHWEGMPNVVLEAMVSGLPIVSTAVEGILELLGENTRGIVVTRDSIEGLAEGIGEVLTHPETGHCLAEAAQQFAAQELTWDSMVRRYIALYERLID